MQGVADYAIYMLDPEGRITNWNLGGERIKGYPANEIVGQHFSIFFTQEDRAKGEPDREICDRNPRRRFEGEGWRVRKDGTMFWAGVVLDRILDQDGKLLGFAKITRDMTEKKEGRGGARTSPRRPRASAEDGGDRPADRRRRARFQ